MANGNQDQLLGFAAGLILGAAIGATAAYLTAPQSGRKTRKRLGKVAYGVKKKTGDRWDDLADEVKGKVDEAITGARKRIGTG